MVWELERAGKKFKRLLALNFGLRAERIFPMADAGTITRIGGILKNVYSDTIVEQQNLAAVARKLFTKAKGVRLGGDHYEVSVRVGGNRAGVGPRNSDDPLPVPGRQQEKKFQIFDRAELGVIRVYDKDIENTRDNAQGFINHLDDEVTGVARDVLKDMNIITFGDGSDTLATVSAGTTAVVTFVASTSASGGFGNWGVRYLQVGDQIDIWSSNFSTQRTPVGGVTITALDPVTKTVTTNTSMTLTATDVVTRANGQNKAYVGLWSATDNGGSTFQGLSRTTYPNLKGYVLDIAGVALTEAHLQTLFSGIESASGEYPDLILTGSNGWDQYLALGVSLKRYINTLELDRGFQQLDYNGVPFTKDVDNPPGAVFGLRREYVQNGVVTPLSWSEQDGAILKWDAGYAAYKGFMREYGNYVYPRPNSGGRIQSMLVSANYQ
jgi:hypothetical protein